MPLHLHVMLRYINYVIKFICYVTIPELMSWKYFNMVRYKRLWQLIFFFREWQLKLWIELYYYIHSTKLFTYILALYIFICMTCALARLNGLVERIKVKSFRLQLLSLHRKISNSNEPKNNKLKIKQTKWN